MRHLWSGYRKLCITAVKCLQLTSCKGVNETCWSTTVLSRLASSYSVKEERVSSSLVLRKVTTGGDPRPDRPLVLLFEWLYANPTAVRKYCELYHDKGLDVLILKGKPKQFLWPPASFAMVEEALRFLLQQGAFKEKYLVHAFSVGAYNYTLMMLLSAEKKEYSEFRKRVIGQIFDSVVVGTYDNMSEGVAMALPSVARKPIMSVLGAYYSVTRKHTRDRYDEFVRFFIENPIQVQSLAFYCLNDPMCDPAAMDRMLKYWDTEFPDFNVDVKVWDQSVHAAHLRFHREEYKSAWENFMRKVGV